MTTPDQTKGLGGASQGSHLSSNTSGSGCSDGWIEWKGGACPVGPDDIVQVELRCGVFIQGADTHPESWAHLGRPADIIAYRLAEQQPPVQEQSTGATGGVADQANQALLEEVERLRKLVADYQEVAEKNLSEAVYWHAKHNKDRIDLSAAQARISELEGALGFAEQVLVAASYGGETASIEKAIRNARAVLSIGGCSGSQARSSAAAPGLHPDTPLAPSAEAEAGQ